MYAILTATACRVLLCVTLVAAPALARTVTGVVTDSDGRPVARAAVRLKNSVTLRIRSQVTDKDGTYRFARLNSQMDYELQASHKKQSSRWVRLSRFDEGDERVIDLRLE
jgi:hypothetical protein